MASGKSSKELLRGRLALAIRNEDVNALQQCLADGADPDWRFESRDLALRVGYGPSPRRALLWCVALGNAPLCRALLDAGARVDPRDLMEAATEETWSDEVAGLLLAHGANVAARDENDEFSHLHVAARNGSASAVRFLLANGADPNDPSRPRFDFGEPEMPLDDADPSCVELLRAAGAKRSSQSLAWQLERAIRSNSVSETVAALSAGAKLNGRLGFADEKPLAYAIQKSALDVARELHSRGAKLPVDPFAELISSYGKPKPEDVQVAASMVRFLVSGGADINAVGGWQKNTVLDRAVRWGDIGLVRELLDMGSDPRKGSPFSGCQSPEILECLLAAGADPGQAIHSVVCSESARVAGTLDRLLAAGVDINQRDNHGNTPLHACLKGWRDNRLAALGILLRHGADPEITDNQGDAAIHLVAERHALAELRVLLAHGVEVDRKDKAGATALHRLQNDLSEKEKGTKLAMSRALLEAGADPNIRNRKRRTPLDLAIRHDLCDVVSYLVSRGARIGSAIPVPHWERYGGQTSTAMIRLFTRLGLGHVDDRSAQGETRMLCASGKAYYKALLGMGADINAQDKQGNNALSAVLRSRYGYFTAAEVANAVASSMLLLEAGLEPSCEQAQRLMELAIERRNVELAAALLRRTTVSLKLPEKASDAHEREVTDFLARLQSAHPDLLCSLTAADEREQRILSSVLETAVPSVEAGRLPPGLLALPEGVDAITVKMLEAARAHPRPRLLSTGEALPDAAMAALLAQLQASASGAPAPGLSCFRELLEPASLVALAWSLVDDWSLKAGKGRGWMLDALVLLGDGTDLRRLGKEIAWWGTSLRFACARHAIGALAADGRDEALRQLHDIARRFPNKAIGGLSAQHLAEAARQRGLDAMQLEDRLVPDLGFDAAGEIPIDYGPRQWKLRLTTDLRPVLVDASGKSLTKLPAPSPSDDPQKASSAAATWKSVGKELRSNAGAQLRRLEHAMINGRRWTGSEFGEFLLNHPFVGTAVRGLVWGIYRPKKGGRGVLQRSFCVLSDGQLQRADGKPLVLAADMLVGIAHPLELGEGLDAWQALFADRAQSQPFAQLTRRIYLDTDAEAERLFDIRGMRVAPGAMRALLARGWDASGDRIRGGISEVRKGKVSVTFEDGVAVYGGDGTVEDRVSDVWGLESVRDPIDYSEFVRELLALRV